MELEELNDDEFKKRLQSLVKKKGKKKPINLNNNQYEGVKKIRKGKKKE